MSLDHKILIRNAYQEGWHALLCLVMAKHDEVLKIATSMMMTIWLPCMWRMQLLYIVLAHCTLDLMRCQFLASGHQLSQCIHCVTEQSHFSLEIIIRHYETSHCTKLFCSTNFSHFWLSLCQGPILPAVFFLSLFYPELKFYEKIIIANLVLNKFVSKMRRWFLNDRCSGVMVAL